MEKEHPRIQYAVMDDGLIRIARHKEHLHVRTLGHQAIRQFGAAHPGHHHIGHHQMDRPVVFFAGAKRMLPITTLQYAVPIVRKNFADQLPHPRFVFHHQDDFRSLLQVDVGLLRPERFHGFLYPRQIDFEGTASLQLAIHTNAAPALFDNPVYGGQPQSRAFAFILGGEKRFEYLRTGFLVHPPTRVAQGQHHVRAGMDPHVSFGGALIQLDIRSLDRKFSAFRHRITGVDRQIHDHLLDLSRIGLDAPDIRIEQRDPFNVLANKTLEHLIHVGHHGIEVQHPRLQHLLAAERQELLRERGGPLGGLLDLLGVSAHRIVVAEAKEQKIAVSRDGNQQVVEIVGNSAGQSPDRFHFLRLTELLFALLQGLLRLFEFRDVVVRHHHHGNSFIRKTGYPNHEPLRLPGTLTRILQIEGLPLIRNNLADARGDLSPPLPAPRFADLEIMDPQVVDRPDQ